MWDHISRRAKLSRRSYAKDKGEKMKRREDTRGTQTMENSLNRFSSFAKKANYTTQLCGYFVARGLLEATRKTGNAAATFWNSASAASLFTGT